MSIQGRYLSVLFLLLAGPAFAQDLQSEEDALSWCHDRGEMFSCTQLAMRYLSGDVPTDDPVGSAVPLLQLACDGDYANACYNLGVAYEQGMVEGKTAEDAAELYAGACALGDGESCTAAVVLYLNGHKKSGMEPDLRRSLALARDGCELRDGWSCYFQAAHYYKGWGVDKDYVAAVDAASAGCSRGNADACKLKKRAQKKAAKQAP